MQKRLFLVCLISAFVFSYFQLKNQNERENEVYYRLKANGIITTVNSEFQEHWDADYYYYFFIAEDGQKIEKTGKCGGIDTFNQEYRDLKVIYNSSNPDEFMEYPHFQLYSTKFPFLWLIISTLFYALFASAIISIGYLIFKGQFKLLINRN